YVMVGGADLVLKCDVEVAFAAGCHRGAGLCVWIPPDWPVSLEGEVAWRRGRALHFRHVRRFSVKQRNGHSRLQMARHWKLIRRQDCGSCRRAGRAYPRHTGGGRGRHNDDERRDSRDGKQNDRTPSARRHELPPDDPMDAALTRLAEYAYQI